MQELTLDFSFKARYYQSTAIHSQTKQVWFVLHGYGHLARFFIRKFESLPENISVVAPEGLSRFYTEPLEKRAVTGNNRVGATWMTAENRLMDIENYLQYLNSVYRQVMEKNLDIPVTILGFSQGAATASRWATHNPEIFQRLILWSGLFPPDMDFKKGNEVLSKKEVALAYGTKDPFLTTQRHEELTMLISKLGITPQLYQFEGGHDIDPETMQKFI